MELDASGQNRGASRLMSSLYTISYVAKMIGENTELVEVVSANSDNIDDGEMFTMWTSQEDGIIAFTDRGIECLKEFLADLRTTSAGIREFLVAENCSQEKITRIIAHELR